MAPDNALPLERETTPEESAQAFVRVIAPILDVYGQMCRSREDLRGRMPADAASSEYAQWQVAYGEQVEKVRCQRLPIATRAAVFLKRPHLETSQDDVEFLKTILVRALQERIPPSISVEAHVHKIMECVLVVFAGEAQSRWEPGVRGEIIRARAEEARQAGGEVLGQ